MNIAGGMQILPWLEFVEGVLEKWTGEVLIVRIPAGLGIRILPGGELYRRLQRWRRLPRRMFRLYIFVYSSPATVHIVGFLFAEERMFLHRLLQIRGIGIRHALAILNHFSPEEFLERIRNEGPQALRNVRGFGEKLISRIFRELQEDSGDMSTSFPTQDGTFPSSLMLASSWLRALGLQPSEYREILQQWFVQHPDSTPEDAVKGVLQELGKSLIGG